MIKKRRTIFSIPIAEEFQQFLRFLLKYSKNHFYAWFVHFEDVKDVLVDLLHRKRGRYARPFLHLAFVALTFMVINVGPWLLSPAEGGADLEDLKGTFATQAYGVNFYTQQAEEVSRYRGGEIITHYVGEGETLGDIAQRYNLEIQTVLWENNLTASSTIKPGQELKILPIDGVRHQVSRGETIFTIAKKYGLSESQAQMIIDYPFNEFLNDETFELAVNQSILVPEGIKPAEKKAAPAATRYVAQTPNAGVVAASGSFGWPASGGISQGYKFYHKAIDISNRSGGPILAADSGTVVVAGFIDNSGYGNRVMVDHGNGYVTLYAHLSVAQVQPGQTVSRGNVLGQMGSTGRSTGTHLHFEIRKDGALLNPLQFLQ